MHSSMQSSNNKLLGNYSSVYSFTRHFSAAYASGLSKHPLSSVALEGGPHTFWWSTQVSCVCMCACMCVCVCVCVYLIRDLYLKRTSLWVVEA